MCLMLAACFLLGILSGCGASETAQSPSAVSEAEDSVAAESAPAEATNSAEAAPSEAAPAESTETRATISYPLADDGTTIKLLIGIPPIVENFDTTKIAAFRKAMEDTGINLEINDLGAALLEQYPLMFASGAYMDYDILADAVANYTGSIDSAIDDEIVICLNDVISEYMPDYDAFLNNEEYAFVKKAITSDSGQIGAISGYTYGNPQGLIIRQDWLDSLNMDVPVTYDDFYAVLSAFKTTYNADQPLLLFSDGSLNSDCISGGYGVSFQNGFVVEDGTVQYSMITDGAKKYFTMMHQWYEEGLVFRDFATENPKTGANYDGLWNAGQIGIMGGGTDYMSDSYTAADDPSYHAIAIADAVENEGDIIHLGYTPSTDFTINASWSISTGCEDVELVANFINWFFTEAGSIACSFGIEGEGYELNEDGNPVYTDLVINNPDGMTLFSTQLMFTSFNTPYLQDARVFDSLYTCEDQREARTIWNSNRDDIGVCVGSLTTEESESYTAKYSDIDTYVSEMVVKFITGDENIDTTWDSYVSYVESMGIADCEALKQDAYDRYQAR